MKPEPLHSGQERNPESHGRLGPGEVGLRAVPHGVADPTEGIVGIKMRKTKGHHMRVGLAAAVKAGRRT